MNDYMNEYIKKEDAIEAIAGRDETGGWCYGTEKVFSSRQVNDIIAGLPHADVVEVVRCDQCRHFDAINNDDHGWCRLISDLPIGVSVRYRDDYCSYGEREDD